MKGSTVWDRSVYAIVLIALSLSALGYLVNRFSEDEVRARRAAASAESAPRR